MPDPSISVVIPAHNAAEFIGEAVRSALAQTCPPVEIIVVDDGSTDGTASVVTGLGSAVRVISQTQAGVSRSRNRAAQAAVGDWLAFLDADDVWMREKLERQIAQIAPETGLVHCDRINVGCLDGLPERQGVIQPPIAGDVFTALLLTGNTITTSCVLMRRALFLALGGFDEQLSQAEDWDLWLKAAAVSEVRAAAEALVRYRLHPSGLSRASEAMNRSRWLVALRALDSERGRALGWRMRRQALAATLATNGWDAARGGRRAGAASAYLRSWLWWPSRTALTGLAQQMLGR